MNHLEISSPHDGSIVLADHDVTFVAWVDRPERANDVVWSQASKPGVTSPPGATFSPRWPATGVDQVVASIDGLTCAVIVYIYKTPSGTGTVGDLMQSEPPPLAQSVESFPKYPRVALRVAS